MRESLIRAESEGLAVPLIEQAAPLESYCYQEGERPEDFFVPCVWTAAVSLLVHCFNLYSHLVSDRQFA